MGLGDFLNSVFRIAMRESARINAKAQKMDKRYTNEQLVDRYMSKNVSARERASIGLALQKRANDQALPKNNNPSFDNVYLRNQPKVVYRQPKGVGNAEQMSATKNIRMHTKGELNRSEIKKALLKYKKADWKKK